MGLWAAVKQNCPVRNMLVAIKLSLYKKQNKPYKERLSGET